MARSSSLRRSDSVRAVQLRMRSSNVPRFVSSQYSHSGARCACATINNSTPTISAMRTCMHVLIALIVGVLLLIVAQAQRAPEWEYCDETNRGTFDERIRNCTALTESDRLSDEDRAIAYHNRGLVRAAKGDN